MFESLFDLCRNLINLVEVLQSSADVVEEEQAREAGQDRQNTHGWEDFVHRSRGELHAVVQCIRVVSQRVGDGPPRDLVFIDIKFTGGEKNGVPVVQVPGSR